jgi:predicted nucleic acid-binding protein
MKYLLDTNILLRLVEPHHERHQEAREALKTLRRQNCVFYILLQNVSEFWNVCTRPSDKNGLGFTIAETDLHLKRFERLFTVLSDTEEVYRYGRSLPKLA